MMTGNKLLYSPFSKFGISTIKYKRITKGRDNTQDEYLVVRTSLSKGVKIATGIRTRKGEKKHLTRVRLIFPKPELRATPSKDSNICIIVRAKVAGESLVKTPYIPESKITRTDTSAQTPKGKKERPSDLKSSERELKIKNK